jgi:hypothetical protein
MLSTFLHNWLPLLVEIFVDVPHESLDNFFTVEDFILIKFELFSAAFVEAANVHIFAENLAVLSRCVCRINHWILAAVEWMIVGSQDFIAIVVND